MTNRRINRLLGVAVIAMGLMACRAPGGDLPPEIVVPREDAGSGAAPLQVLGETAVADTSDLPTVVERLTGDNNLVFTVNAMSDAGLLGELDRGGPYTVFAPANTIYSTAGLLTGGVSNAAMAALLRHHVIPQRLTPADFMVGERYTTLNGTAVQVNSEDNTIYIDYLPLPEPLLASNGVVYILDGMLLPPEATGERSMWGIIDSEPELSTFASLMRGTDLMYMLRFGFPADAVLAPVNAAFAALPAETMAQLQTDQAFREFFLNYYLLKPDGWPQGTPLLLANMAEFDEVPTAASVRGSGFGFGYLKVTVIGPADDMRINQARIVAGDLTAVNGAVHTIDTVLVPPAGE